MKRKMNHTLLIGLVTLVSGGIITLITSRKEKKDEIARENEKKITAEKQDSLASAQQKAIEILEKNQVVYQNLMNHQKETIDYLTGADSWIYVKLYADPESRVRAVAELIGEKPIRNAQIEFYDKIEDESYYKTIAQLYKGDPINLERDMKQLLHGEELNVQIRISLFSGSYVQRVMIDHNQSPSTTNIITRNGKEILRHFQPWNVDLNKLTYNTKSGLYSLSE